MTHYSRKTRSLGFLVGTCAGFWFIAPACSSDEGSLDPGTGGRTNAGGGSVGLGGATRGGASSGGRAGGSAGNPGMAGAAGSGSGEGGSENGGQGGSSGGDTTEPPGPVCIFHSDPVVDPSVGGVPGSGGSAGAADAGAGGEAGSEPSGSGGSGGAGPVYDITAPKNPFVGTYLADSTGKALYLFGADQAGDCDNLPISTCEDASCPLAWPIFNAGERVLAPGLDDALFGTIERADGTHQTTYRGWPLYYYRNDREPGDVNGHAVGRVWHLAEVNLPNLVLLRIGTQRLLGDGNGKALYVFAEDAIGSSTAAPISACTGTCRRDFPPFTLPSVSPVSYLEPGDFSIFVRSDGGAQVAYRGAPLYYARADTRSGQTNGTAVAGWTVAAP